MLSTTSQFHQLVCKMLTSYPLAQLSGQSIISFNSLFFSQLDKKLLLTAAVCFWDWKMFMESCDSLQHKHINNLPNKDFFPFQRDISGQTERGKNENCDAIYLATIIQWIAFDINHSRVTLWARSILFWWTWMMINFISSTAICNRISSNELSI